MREVGTGIIAGLIGTIDFVVNALLGHCAPGRSTNLPKVDLRGGYLDLAAKTGIDTNSRWVDVGEIASVFVPIPVGSIFVAFARTAMAVEVVTQTLRTVKTIETAGETARTVTTTTRSADVVSRTTARLQSHVDEAVRERCDRDVQEAGPQGQQEPAPRATVPRTSHRQGREGLRESRSRT